MSDFDEAEIKRLIEEFRNLPPCKSWEEMTEEERERSQRVSRDSYFYGVYIPVTFNPKDFKTVSSGGDEQS